MDKYEYKVRSDEIKGLITRNEFAQAVEIADTIDWRRVKSASMLCTISDLYKINRRYEDAKNVMLLAYERRPGGRTICYSLCELCIKTEEFVQAVNYYKEFVQAAPKDSGRYILQYKLYEAQEVSLEERIGVLEELKKRDYQEKWAYELAYLYHRVGLPARCVEECDELILWFGEGKYVVKAMELKMLHEPLTLEQQEKYEHRFDQAVQEAAYDDGQMEYGQEEAYAQGVGQWEDYGQQEGQWESHARQEGRWETYARQEVQWEDGAQQEDYGPAGDEWMSTGGQGTAGAGIDAGSGQEEEEELDIQVKTIDVGQYNTINLQAELAAGLQEVLGADKAEGTEVFFGETGEVESVSVGTVQTEKGADRTAQTEAESGSDKTAGAPKPMQDAPEKAHEESVKTASISREAAPLKEMTASETETAASVEMVSGATAASAPPMPGASGVASAQPMSGAAGAASADRSSPAQNQPVKDDTAELVLAQMRMESIGNAPQAGEKAAQEQHVLPPKELTNVLSQGSDGQISLVLPERIAVEKQITGQIKIEDILAEWERAKKDNQEKCKEEVRQHVLQQTGPMFTEFEAAVRDGLLEQLEKGEAGTAVEAAPTRPAGGGEVQQASQEKQADTENPTQEKHIGAEKPAQEKRTDAEKLAQEKRIDTEKPSQEKQAEMEEPLQEKRNGAEKSSQEESRQTTEKPRQADGEEQAVQAKAPAAVEHSVGAGHAEGAVLPLAEKKSVPFREAVKPQAVDRMKQNKDVVQMQTAEMLKQITEAVQTQSPGKIVSISEAAQARAAEKQRQIQEAEKKKQASEVQEADSQKRVQVKAQEADSSKQTQASKAQEADGQKQIQASKAQEQMTEAQKPGITPQQTEAQPPEKSEKSETLENIETTETVQTTEQTNLDGKASAEDFSSEELPMERDAPRIRSLTREERELYAPFIQSRSAKEQLVQAIDNVSMAAYTGNVVVTGEEGMDTLTFAKNMARELKMIDSNFSGRVAKISGQGLNQKDVGETLWHLNNGALIIYHASGMDAKTAASLYKSLQQEHLGIVIIMEDTKKAIQRLFLGTPELFSCFTSRMDLEALSNDTLVSFGRKYAREMEYSIDEMGVLALHTRIEELQTIDHVVTVVEVKKIVDEAIRHACKKTLGHFFDILFAKRYDEEDMIILTEKDFA